MNDQEMIVAQLRLAARTGTYRGLIDSVDDVAYIRRCTRMAVLRDFTGVGLIFTRDEGHHAVGWWKNPDYERCWHLSLSFVYPNGEAAPYDFQEANRWARLVFGHDCRWLWVEGPYSPKGKARDVHHYRLFTDPNWQALKPRGEVYTKEFTEVGWKSFSEQHGEAVAAQYSPPMGYEP